MNKNDSLSTQLATWNRRIDDYIPREEYLQAFLHMKSVTISTRIRDFQYRLLANLLVFNKHLKAWKMLDYDTCNFCNNAVETIMYALFECLVTKRFWQDIQDLLNNICSEVEVAMSVKNIVLGSVVKPKPHVFNLYILLAKKYIYACRCQKNLPNISAYLKIVQTTREIEWYIAHKNDKLKYHYRKWSSIPPIP